MKKIKNNDLVVIVLSILIVVLVFLGIYSYVNYVKNKNDGGTYQKLDVNSDQIKQLVFLTRGNHNRTLFYGTDYYNIYYKEDFIKTSDLNEDFKKLLSYYTLERSLFDYSNNNTVFKADDLKRQYASIFGDTANYKNEDIYCNCPSKIVYLPADGTYVLEGAFGSIIMEGYISRLIDAKKYDNRIEIYEKVVFYVEDENTGNISYYKDSSFREKIIETSENKQFKFEEYQKQYNTYKYTFMLENGVYYFESVERIK